MLEKTCIFFGHRDCPHTIKGILRATVVELIEKEKVKTFLVGSQGRFDSLALQVLKELKIEFPYIRYAVVLAYLKHANTCAADVETVFPEGLEMVHPKFAISARNKWMVEQADFVVAFVEHRFGGAFQFVELAKRKGKRIIHLTQTDKK